MPSHFHVAFKGDQIFDFFLRILFHDVGYIFNMELIGYRKHHLKRALNVASMRNELDTCSPICELVSVQYCQSTRRKVILAASIIFVLFEKYSQRLVGPSIFFLSFKTRTFYRKLSIYMIMDF